jgi:hypothetical protein
MAKLPQSLGSAAASIGTGLAAAGLGTLLERGSVKGVDALTGRESGRPSGLGTGALMSGLYAASLGPKGLRGRPLAFAALPSITGSLWHAVTGYSDTPAMQAKIATARKALGQAADFSDEGMRGLGRQLADSHADQVRTAATSAAGVARDTLGFAAGDLVAGGIGGAASLAIMSGLLAANKRNRRLTRRRTTTRGEMAEELARDDRAAARDNALRMLATAMGGYAGAQLNRRYRWLDPLSKDKEAARLSPKVWKHVLSGAAAFAAHPFIEDVASKGSFADGHYSRARALPTMSGEGILENAATAALSSGGSRWMSALAAGTLLGRVKPIPFVSLAAAPGIASGVLRRMLPSGGFSDALATTNDVARLAANASVGGAQAREDAAKSMLSGYASGVGDNLKEVYRKELAPSAKKALAYTLAASLGGVGAGMAAKALYRPRVRAPGELVQSPEDMREIMEDVRKREHRRRMLASAATVLGAGLGAGAMKLYQEARKTTGTQPTP